MSRSRVLLATFLVVLAALLAAPSGSVAQMVPRAGEAMVLPRDAAPLVAHTDQGDAIFSVEIAYTGEMRSRGLMFREEMDEDHGMLFVFENTTPVSFWMKNTPLPLDLVFIGEDGLVESIGEGVPFSTASIPSGAPVRFVLEINRGVAQKTGIVEGTRISHPRIDAVAGGG